MRRPGRRGVLFLISALLLVAIFFTIMYSQRLPTEREKAESIRSRIATMDDFLKDFHQDIERATFISGFRALIALEQYISEEGSFVDEPGPPFVEAFMNGSIDGDPYEVLDNSTFSEYLARVNAEAAAVGILLDASARNISLNQSTPWSVDVTFEMVVNLSDRRGLARWDYRRNFTTQVSILDLRDPVYSVYTNGKVPTTFRVSPYNMSEMVDGNDTTILNDELSNMYYREDALAPSFLQRLAGELNRSSKYGVASLVDLDQLDAQGLVVESGRSVLDSVYFGGAAHVPWCPGKGEPLPSWFKLDQEHYLDSEHNYELDDLNASTC